MDLYNKSKISKLEMIEEIKEELIIYFRKGIINPKTFFNIDENRFKNMKDILKIHFILSKEVSDYTLNLEKTIRNIKNSTRLDKKLFKGEVRGNIDWNKTIEYRSNRIEKDRSNFICDNIDKLYDIKENLILKKAISIIYNIIHIDIAMDRFHGEAWYKNGPAMSTIISNVYRKNVYLKRIDISNVKITDKMIFDVLNSRNKIYRDSARILKLYRSIMRFDKEQVEKLFGESFIHMQDENKVFELYSIFKYIRENFPREELKYNILDGREDCLARVEEVKYTYDIFHDSFSKSQLAFNIDKSEIEGSQNLYLDKKLKILAEKNRIYSQLEKKTPPTSIWAGRPDLLIVKRDKTSQAIVKISIGEVKYTNDRKYMYRGMEELLEYMYLVKDRENKYIEDIAIEGLLFVDNISLEKKKFKDIQIINR